ncbi:MAG: LLM class flavin-dependent oxidoreductase [Alphaproteobacteria bacterium]|nr:LLM class flavin-dependent oxidoreductase [Alphaproteobacteria bacterium]
MQFFPDVGPGTMSGAEYWDDALRLTALCDELGYTHVRTVEHHFNAYGGYSPNPHLFLAAAAMRTKKARLVTGAVLPVFNNPLKIAGEICMLDAISGGRLECGFARAFLPHEFDRFGVSLDESKARFAEGMEQVRLLLEGEDVSHAGAFHSFSNVTIMPRPTQKPRPPFWIAALATPASFVGAGEGGHSIMAIPLAGGMMSELLAQYREAWKSAGHPGIGRVMLAHHMFCHEDHDAAVELARQPLNRYLKSLVDAASDWTGGSSSADYPGYDKIIAGLAKDNFESQVAKHAAWVGTPDEICDQISDFVKIIGGFEIASLQVNFNDIAIDDAVTSTRLFAEKVIPKFA